MGKRSHRDKVYLFSPPDFGANRPLRGWYTIFFAVFTSKPYIFERMQ
jgi:hypothetical protein